MTSLNLIYFLSRPTLRDKSAKASCVHSGKCSLHIKWSLVLQNSGCSGASRFDPQHMAGVQVISPYSVGFQVSMEMSLPQESLLHVPD